MKTSWSVLAAQVCCAAWSKPPVAHQLAPYRVGALLTLVCGYVQVLLSLAHALHQAVADLKV
jgi:hypothetical protein